MVWATPIVYYFGLAVYLLTVIIEGLAFVHCVTRKGTAFPVVSSISKGGWTLMIGVAFLITALTGVTFLSISANFLYVLVAFVGFVIAAVYLLDIRPALRDALDGRGGW
jgi:Protein of unknown function (DUF2516)